LDIPSGEGPLELDYGPCPVRLWPDRVGEVVWGVRIDPCRVVIEASVPLPESGHRWRDVVLHDGVPVGSRVFHGRELAVFDELDVWSTSTEVTIELIAPGIGEADFQALLDAAISQDCICENWSSSIRWICEECSTGQPNASHKHPEIAEGENRIALAGERDRLVELVRAWSSTRPHLDVTVSTPPPMPPPLARRSPPGSAGNASTRPPRPPLRRGPGLARDCPTVCVTGRDLRVRG
jgi:hypothetical protein